MSDRLAWILSGVLGIAFVTVNAAIKPGFDAREIQSAAAFFGSAAQWDNRLAPDFELTLRDGSAFRLADHVGREVVVLNFFATWCGPCRAEMPELQRYATRMAAESRPFLLVGIDAEEQPQLVDAFVRDLALTFDVGIDASGEVMRKYGVSSFPTTVIIGADGRVKLYQTGAISNGDVAFTPLVTPELTVLAEGRGASRQAYLDALEKEPDRPSAAAGEDKDAADAASLTGRALSIAQAMPCPCGCSDRVIACNCKTAKGIRARLGEPLDPQATDRQIMERLNEEFCMKGM